MESVVKDKSKKFAVRIIRLYQYLSKEKREHELARQVLRSGTSVGANVREALQGQSGFHGQDVNRLERGVRDRVLVGAFV